MSASTTPLLLNLDDAAAALGGISTRYLRLLAQTKKVPSVRLGKRLMFDPADLRAFVEDVKAGRVEEVILTEIEEA